MSKYKVALITGSKEGIGFQTALQLAARNWRVIMADNQDLQCARREIINQTRNDMIETKYFDLSSFTSVRRLACEIINEEKYLHVLINNAGIFESNVVKTEDSLDPVMQINHLGPFLLTCLLTDLLKKSSPSRIIFVTSSGAFLHNLNIKTLPVDTDKQNQCTYSNLLTPLFTYYNSKLCNMIISHEFSKRLQKFNVTSNCLHPGMTTTNFLYKNRQHTDICYKILSPLIKLTTQDVVRSASLITFLAHSSTLEKTTGKYFYNYQASCQPKIVNNCEYSLKVWQQAENLVCMQESEQINFK